MHRDHEHELLDPSAEERYRHLRSSGLFAEARRFEAELRRANWARTAVLWRSEDPAATPAGRQLYHFDREMRRATAIVRMRRFHTLPHPVPLRDGRLEISQASVGSLDLLLEGVGLVAMVLLSNPVQLTLTTRALLGDAVRVAAWLRDRDAKRDEPDLFIELPGGGRVGARRRIEVQGYRPDGSIDRIIAE